jgi:hypothetical protein
LVSKLIITGVCDGCCEALSRVTQPSVIHSHSHNYRNTKSISLVSLSSLLTTLLHPLPRNSPKPICLEEEQLIRTMKSSVSNPCRKMVNCSLMQSSLSCFVDGSTLVKATDENLTGENWEIILNLCDKVTEEGEEGYVASAASLLALPPSLNPTRRSHHFPPSSHRSLS